MTVEDVVREFTAVIPSDGGVQFHFPGARDGILPKESPLSSYVFVATDLPDTTLLKLERSPIVDMVLCTPGSVGRWRQVSRISDEELETIIARELSDVEISIGSRVSIEKGMWAGLFGQVLEVLGDKVVVYIEFHSRKRVVTLDREEVVLTR